MLHSGVAGPVLFPCGNTRREELPRRLEREGVRVDEVVCYESRLAGESEARAAVAGATLLIVASPSVAQLLIDACPPGSRPDLIAVGPTTASAARDGRWEPAAVASHPAQDAVIAAVREVLARRSVS
jgi:uroporphyrinogen-III synthase